jgi:hypothetical protein
VTVRTFQTVAVAVAMLPPHPNRHFRPKLLAPFASSAAEKSASLTGHQGKVIQSIVVAVAMIFILSFSAQKTHVKPLNHLSTYESTTSPWHFS